MGGLEGRKVLVVGASSGTGRACAIALARGGADVVFAARRRPQLEAAVAEAGCGHAVIIDVLDPDDLRRGVDEAVERLGGLDGVLYTAGMSPLVPLRALSAELWQTIFGVNVFGPNLLTAATLPYLSDDAVVAVVSSDSSSQPRHSLVPYGAAKAALEATLEGWRTEEIGGRRFLTIVLGPTWPSEFADAFPPDAFAELIPHWQRQGFRTGMLAATDVAEQVAVTFATMFASPTFGVEQILLRAPEPAVPVTDFGHGEHYGDAAVDEARADR